MNEPEIINTLRRAPAPKAPAGLKEQLVSQIPPSDTARNSLIHASSNPRSALAGSSQTGWLKRWWPALASGAGALACAAVITAQRSEVRDLRASIASLSTRQAPTIESVQPITQSMDTTTVAQKYEREIERLKRTAAELSDEIARMEQMKVQNANMRTQIRNAVTPGLTQAELDDIEKAKQNADNVRCINNLKRIGLAARVWALDNGDVLPPNFLSMSNELSTPKILVCPADTSRVVANIFSDFTPANCTYEFLAPSASESEPLRLLTRCPIHGNIGICDGSVHQAVAKVHPELIVTRDGKLYYELSKTPVEAKPTNAKP